MKYANVKLVIDSKRLLNGSSTVLCLMFPLRSVIVVDVLIDLVFLDHHVIIGDEKLLSCSIALYYEVSRPSETILHVLCVTKKLTRENPGKGLLK